MTRTPLPGVGSFTLVSLKSVKYDVPASIVAPPVRALISISTGFTGLPAMMPAGGTTNSRSTLFHFPPPCGSGSCA